MKRQLGVLLLIFIATVGLSSVASAQPLAQGPMQGPSYGHGMPGHGFWHWVVVRRFITSSPITVVRLRHIFPPPIYRITVIRIGNHRFLVTVWRRTFSPIFRGTMHHPGMMRR